MPVELAASNPSHKPPPAIDPECEDRAASVL